MGLGVDVIWIEETVSYLDGLLKQLSVCDTVFDRIEVLDAQDDVKKFLKNPSPIRTFLAGLNPECEWAIKSVLVLGQGQSVLSVPEEMPDKFERLRLLLNQLIEIDQFYAPIGGLIGYHLSVLKLLQGGEQPKGVEGNVHFSRPHGVDLTAESRELRQAVYAGVEGLEKMAEIYPVGGAGDRLALVDEGSGCPLPAALLPFNGRSLLEGMIRDLQAREYLYFKLFGKQMQVPIAMMTSDEKRNHDYMLSICEKAAWFGRSPEGFKFFKQPCVPVVSQEGWWCMRGPLELMLKPGGHGVMWLLAKQAGIFSHFAELGREQVLVRQINNPVADTDGGTFGLTGWGLLHGKAFGFASCKRLLHTAEGVNVLRQEERKDGVYCCYTNIEYTDFEKYGLCEEPESPESPYSEYPANTNILFANLDEVDQALTRAPIPGMIVNFKSEVSTWLNGKWVTTRAGRLESTMQNIADVMEDVRPTLIDPAESPNLRTYVTSNVRRKTISVTKRTYRKGKPLEETPEGCFSIQQQNYGELLRDHCQFSVPDLRDANAYVRGEVPYLIQLHPAIGPLYAVIAQKLRGGTLARGAELQLDLAEVDIDNLSLKGSLVVRASSPLGVLQSNGTLKYGHNGARCHLQNVRIDNQGMDVTQTQPLWKNQVSRRESVQIILHEGAEFVAKDLTLKGAQHFEVPRGKRLTLKPHASGFESVLETIEAPSWYWSYRVDGEYRILLKKVGV